MSEDEAAPEEEACLDLSLRRVVVNCRAKGLDRCKPEEACATAAARGTREADVAVLDIWRGTLGRSFVRLIQQWKRKGAF